MAIRDIPTRQTAHWGVLCRSSNALDGDRSWLEGDACAQSRTALFPTRKAAASHIEEKWGYLKDRPDLRAEPHGWRMPRPVRVTVAVTLAEGLLPNTARPALTAPFPDAPGTGKHPVPSKAAQA